MYQSEIKESFIKDYMKSRVVAKTSLYSLFNKTEKFEKRLNKDCYQFTEDEVLNMYKEFKSKSVNVLLNYNVILKAYSAYQIYYQKLNIDNVYQDISKDKLMPLVPEDAMKVLSREDIINIEEQLLNWTDKAIVEALFEGLSGNSMRDLISVNESMINHKTKQLVFSDGRVFKLTDRLHHLLVKSFGETEYICYGKTFKVKKLTGIGCLYKERDNAHALESDDRNFRWVYRKIQNIRKYVGINNLTMKNLAAAGLVHYLREGMNQTGLGLKEFLLTENGKEIMDKYGYNSAFRVDNIVNRYEQIV